MTDNERLLEVLARIEGNQRSALQMQQQHLQVAQAQLDRSSRTIEESVQLQRLAVSRQAQITRFVIPLICVLLVLLVYLVIKWRII